jgi:hypothetical protein
MLSGITILLMMVSSRIYQESLDIHVTNLGSMMKKSMILILTLLSNQLLLSSCAGSPERELLSQLNSRPPALAMPYENPKTILDSVPDPLPFTFIAPSEGELLGTVEDHDRESGTILLMVDQSASDILAYYTNLLTDSSFADTRDSHSHQVFFPSEGSGATFCRDQDSAIVLKINNLEDGLKDVRLHYTTDQEVIQHTTCGQSILALEDFPFPYLPAPPSASNAGDSWGGGGGGGRQGVSHAGPLGYASEMAIITDDSLEGVNNHYVDLLVAEGWILINQSSTSESFESHWDFGYYETRSWLARLTVSIGDVPSQFHIELRAISP